MKKWMVVPALTAFAMLLCVFLIFLGPAYSENPPAEEKGCFYVVRSPWDSAFDPHKLIDEWVALTMDVDSDGLLIMMFGNPKLNWEVLIKTQPPIDEITLPPGEIAKMMTYVFIPREDGQLELYGYGYTTEGGGVTAYRWNGERYKEIKEAAGKGSI
jgi:hypothetical protein